MFPISFTSVLKALPGKFDIKRHSPSILYLVRLKGPLLCSCSFCACGDQMMKVHVVLTIFVCMHARVQCLPFPYACMRVCMCSCVSRLYLVYIVKNYVMKIHKWVHHKETCREQEMSLSFTEDFIYLPWPKLHVCTFG